MPELKRTKNLRGWAYMVYLIGGMLLSMFVYYALGGAAHRHFHRGVFAPEVLIGLGVAVALCVWDPIDRLLGPPVEKPPLPRLIQAAIFVGIGCLLSAATVAGALLTRGDGNARIFALLVGGLSGFSLIVSAAGLSVGELQDRRRRSNAPDGQRRTES
jgi:hypothetical protein